jgi:Tfp pilus assembly PilM family ATPase
MPTHLSSGISVSDDFANFVVLKISDPKTELIHIEEYRRTESDNDDTWFLKPISMRSESIFEKPKNVSVALDKKMLFIHSFPLDSTLSKIDQNEHLNWELSQLIPSFHSKDYVSDTHILQTHVQERKHDILSVTIKRTLINQIHDYTAQKNLHLNIIDAAHFAAGEALAQTYPEIQTHDCALVGLSMSQIEFSCYNNGHLLSYSHRPGTNIEFVLQYLKHNISEKNLNSIYIYGPNADSEMVQILRTEISSQINILNPFSRINISSSVRNFELFTGNEQRFAPAVGIALRKS